jgi:hypothetical protein
MDVASDVGAGDDAAAPRVAAETAEVEEYVTEKQQLSKWSGMIQS